MAGDTLYVASWDGALYAVAAASGRPDWHYDTGGWVTAFAGHHRRQGIRRLERRRLFYALAAGNGALAWRYRTGPRIQAGAAVPGDTLFFGSADGYLYALGCAARRTALALPGSGRGGDVPARRRRRQRLRRLDLERRFYALDAVTGRLRWSFEAGGAFESSPAVAGGTVYVGADDGRLYPWARDGSLLWQYHAGNMIRSSPAAWGPLVFVGSDDGYVYGLDRETGAVAWRYRTAGAIAAGVTVAGNHLYVSCTDRAAARLHAGDEVGGAE